MATNVSLNNPPQDGKMRVLILPFENTSGNRHLIDVRVETLLAAREGEEPKTRQVDRYAHAALSEVERVLGQHIGPTFALVERKRANTLLEEIGFHNTGMVSPETRLELGRMSGASVICTGTITSLGTKSIPQQFYNVTSTKHVGTARLNLRFIDVETGEIIGLGGYDGVVEEVQIPGQATREMELELPAIAEAFQAFEADERLISKIIPDAVQINIDSEPSKARVLIAGRTVGRTPFERKAALGEIISISLQKDGFEQFEREFTLDDDLIVSETLQPIEETQ